MATREEIDHYFGHPGFDQTESWDPPEAYDECGRCRHERWTHSGYGGKVGRPGQCGRRGCGCVYFVEPAA